MKQRLEIASARHSIESTRKPRQPIRAHYPKTPRHRPRRRRQANNYEIATELIDEIYLKEGELHGDAISRCLRCEFPGRDVTKDFSFQPFRKHFLDGVVAPVQATFESCGHA